MGFSVMRDVNHHFLKCFFKYIYSFLDELLIFANVAAQMGYKYNILDLSLNHWSAHAYTAQTNTGSSHHMKDIMISRDQGC